MRAAKRAPIGQPAAGNGAGDRMDHRDFQQFARLERWQNGWQARGQHRFAGTGRAVHQKIVAASRGDLQRALGALLPADVGQVGRRDARAAHRGFGTAQHLRAFEMVGELDKRARRQHVEVAGCPRRLRPAGLRTDQPVAARIGCDGGGEDAGDGRDRAVQCEFAQHRIAGQRIGRQRADRGHHAQCDRQVVVAAFLRQIGRRQIDGDPSGRQREAGGDQRRANPLTGFADGFVAEPDDVENDRAG